MKAHVLTGTREQIVERLSHIDGDIREAIVLVEEAPSTLSPVPATAEEMFAEMEPHVAHAGEVDYSREAIYSPLEGE